MSKHTFFLIGVVLIVVIGILPVLAMIVDTFMGENGFDFSYYREFIETSGLIKSFQNSLLVSSLVSLSTTFIGVGLGIVFGKTDFAFSKFFVSLLLIPLLIPPYIVAFGWFQLLGREGFFGELLFGFWGTSFVLFCIYLPIPILLTIFFLAQINPRLEEAARVVTGWSGVLKNITLPLISPAIILSFMLVFILSFGEFSVANFLRYNLISLESFVQFSAFYDFKAATVSAMPLVVVALLVLLVEQLFLHKHISRFTTPHRIEYISLGRYKNIIFFFVTLFVLLIVITPLFTILFKVSNFSSFQIAMDKAFAPLLRSILYASIGATILMIFGFLNGYIIENRVFKWWRLWDASLIFLFALPATVIGIALILFYNRPLSNFIYITPMIIIFGYVGKYLALTTKIIQTRLSQIPPSLSESAQMVGAKWYQILYFILLPISKKILIISWIIGFIFCFRENTITMLVYPPGSDTLPIYIITQMANGKPEIIASLSIIMIVATLFPLGVFGLYSKIKKKKNYD